MSTYHNLHRNVVYDYPPNVCAMCAVAARRAEAARENGRPFTLVGGIRFNKGTCGVCWKIKLVTRPDEFDFPIFEGHKSPLWLTRRQ